MTCCLPMRFILELESRSITKMLAQTSPAKRALLGWVWLCPWSFLPTRSFLRLKFCQLDEPSFYGHGEIKRGHGLVQCMTLFHCDARGSTVRYEAPRSATLMCGGQRSNPSFCTLPPLRTEHNIVQQTVSQSTAIASYLFLKYKLMLHVSLPRANHRTALEC